MRVAVVPGTKRMIEALISTIENVAPTILVSARFSEKLRKGYFWFTDASVVPSNLVKYLEPQLAKPSITTLEKLIGDVFTAFRD